MSRYVIRCLISLSLLSGAAFAADHGPEEAIDHGATAHDEHEFHRHHLSLFLGVTDGKILKEVEREGGEPIELSRDRQEFTAGLDYIYRVNQYLGVGALVDYAGGDFDFWVIGVPFVLHATNQLKFMVAPGFEDRTSESREFLVRLGVSYDFEVGNFTLAPAFNVDLVDGEETFVYGINLGRGF